MRLAERSDAPAERVRVVRVGRGPTLTLSRKSDRLTALRRSSPLPTGEGGRVRVHEPKRLRPLTQEAVDEGGLAGTVRTGEEDEGGHRGEACSLIERKYTVKLLPKARKIWLQHPQSKDFSQSRR